MVVALELKNK
ncbi:Protein of unknown function [Bacillus cytotoxicus]|uniref:Uncharacterized protein n=1 Tax=Bacillus cytotoxicus TaxID=580165 RepID=A0AAX2CHY1_9BACI|nr:Protein of unknown function [Bacillus cytotoxicus]